MTIWQRIHTPKHWPCSSQTQTLGLSRQFTSVGLINLRIPKLRRRGYFPEDLLVHYSRADRTVVAASEVVTSGVSMRKVERAAATLDIDRMSASQVSRICESLDDAVTDLHGRNLSNAVFPYIWVELTSRNAPAVQNWQALSPDIAHFIPPLLQSAPCRGAGSALSPS